MANHEKSPVLILPKDKKLVAKLRRKLEEYKHRIESYHEQHPNQHPVFREIVLAIEICKMTILEQLLANGKVVAWDASKKFIEERQKKDKDSAPKFVDAWMRAWPVIKDYCETGGAKIHGGTGLK